MATSSRLESIDNLGDVRITKKTGIKRVSMRLHTSGEVRVSIPYYLPYSAGVLFVRSHSEWITKQKSNQIAFSVYDGMKIGKRHTLNLLYAENKHIRVSNNIISIVLPYGDKSIQTYNTDIKKAIKRALQKEAKEILPTRLHQSAILYNLPFKGVNTKPMKSRWGSCSSNKTVTLNCYLLMLPWEIIDYVLVHELSHTKHMNHGKHFWREVERCIPQYKVQRKQLKSMQPSVHSFYV